MTYNINFGQKSKFSVTIEILPKNLKVCLKSKISPKMVKKCYVLLLLFGFPRRRISEGDANGDDLDLLRFGVTLLGEFERQTSFSIQID